MMAVRVGEGSPEGRPQQLIEFDPATLDIGGFFLRLHDIAADGEAFYTTHRPMVEPPPPVTHINLIQHWFEELKAKVPVKQAARQREQHQARAASLAARHAAAPTSPVRR
jgi:hypothetical protein